MTLNKLLLIAVVYFSIHWSQTFARKNSWPLSSFAMYSESLIFHNQVPIFKINLKDGRTLYQSPLKLLPTDYYKSLIFVRKTFYEPKSRYFAQKPLFIKTLLKWNEYEMITKSVEVLSINVHDLPSLKTDKDYLQKAVPIYTYEVSNEMANSLISG
ncbi:MAG: hypothetical protein CME63_09275 [Halobacteriovoraceae bacterium]|nr:hypothetical protein [Halobacteriovoraceae bacterium]|tara:strand:- start:125407 stop:125874 length:468 start_codon:yes stop_codon:yes gene_type:complete